MPERKDERLVLAQQLRANADYIRGYVAAYDAEQCTEATFRAAMLAAAMDMHAFGKGLLDHPEACPWRPTAMPPAADPAGQDLPVQVLGLVDDPDMRLNGDEPFVDVVAWWPAKRKWTVTHCTRAEESATDYEVNVAAWQPMLPIPPRGTLWD